LANRSIVIRDGRKAPLFWVSPGIRQQDVIRQLGPDQPIIGLYPPEPAGNGPPPSFAEMAAYYVESICAVRRHGPYALTGWCAGGAASFEIARQLRSRGEAVDALIMIDPLDLALSHAQGSRETAFFKVRFNFNRMLYHLHEVESRESGLAYCARCASLIGQRAKRAAAHRFHRLRFDSGWQLPARMLEIDRPDDYAFRNYSPQPYAGSATIIRPLMFKYAFEYPNRRWAQVLQRGLEIREVPGDYESMWHGPGAKAMSQVINSCLN